MKDVKDLLPWQVTDISLRPYEGYWSFNPSIHFDGATWRCVLRCCDYAMPGGVTIRSKSARPTGQQTKNAMVILDPATWQPATIYKIQEIDSYPRTSTPHVGYEDMRIFKTDKGGLQGVAASLHLKRDRDARAHDGRPQHQPPEQVIVSFDDAYNIVAAQPIRGGAWSGTPQKNWVPFDRCAEPFFLYSIGKGTLFNGEGMVEGAAAVARSSTAPRPFGVSGFTPRQGAPTPVAAEPVVDRREPIKPPPKPVDRRTMIRGGDVQMVRGRRLSLDASASRPSVRSMSRPVTSRAGDGSARVTRQALMPRYDGLRGGTQLVQIGDDAWLGIGHEMKFINNKKYYWHTWYVVDSRGKLIGVSEPMKFAQNGIEFAAGMGIDGDRVVVSFGVDDMECKLGETKLSAVLETLRAPSSSAP